VPEPIENSTDADEAEIRHLPVLAEVPEARPVPGQAYPLAAPSVRFLPAPLVAAAGGFLAGVAAFVLVRLLRRDAGRARRPLTRRGRRRLEREIAASRTFLVDVHLLKR
jgi:hypothetical protein